MSAKASQITSLTIVYSTVEAQFKENIKAPRHWPLWGEITGDRWIPRTKGSSVDDVIMKFQTAASRSEKFSQTIPFILVEKCILLPRPFAMNLVPCQMIWYEAIYLNVNLKIKIFKLKSVYIYTLKSLFSCKLNLMFQLQIEMVPLGSKSKLAIQSQIESITHLRVDIGNLILLDKMFLK